MKTTKKKVTEKTSTILYRSETNKMLGGVCGGLGEVFSIDPTVIRVLFCIAFFFGGSGVILYILLWIIIPAESKLKMSSDENIKENIEEMKTRAKELTTGFENKDTSRILVGGAVIAIGVMFLLSNFGYAHIFNINKLWPIFIIILGIVMLTRKNEGK